MKSELKRREKALNQKLTNINDAILGMLQAAEAGIIGDLVNDDSILGDIFKDCNKSDGFESTVETDVYGNSQLVVNICDCHFEIKAELLPS